MVSFAWMSCIRYARTRWISTLATTTRFLAPIALSLSSDFWSRRDCLLQQTWKTTWSSYDQTLTILTIGKADHFVGVITERNCNQYNRSAILTKKNTSTANRGVLGAVCYGYGTVISLIVSSRTYLINFFAGCYV